MSKLDANREKLTFDRKKNDSVLPEQFGEIEGYPAGSWFASRKDLSDKYVHRPFLRITLGQKHQKAV